MNRCHVGARAPENVTIDVVPSESLTNLATVSAVSAQVVLHDGTQKNWTFDIVQQSSTLLVLRHTFASDGSDCDRPGLYEITISLTAPGGSYPCNPATMPVDV